MTDAVAVRTAIIRQQAHSLRKFVLRWPQISIERRLNVASAYIWSKGLFQAGTWPDLPCNIYKLVHHAILSVFRAVSGIDGHFANLFTDDDIVYKLGVMCPQTMLRCLRMSLLSRFLGKGNVLLAKIVLNSSRAPGTWANTIVNDLKWLCQSTVFSSYYGCDLEQWFEVIYRNSVGFSKAMMKFCRLPYANICCQWAIGRGLQSLSEEYACPLCDWASRLSLGTTSNLMGSSALSDYTLILRSVLFA